MSSDAGDSGSSAEDESAAAASDSSDYEGQQSDAADGSSSDEECSAEEEEDAGADADAAAAPEPTQEQLEERRAENIRALVSGEGLALRRQAMLPRLLTVQQAAVVLRRAFKSPHPNAPAVSQVGGL